MSWLIEDARHDAALESVFALGNGYLGVRGAPEEGTPAYDGGMVLNGYPLAKDSGMALLGTNAAGLPSITWATGPNGANGEPKQQKRFIALCQSNTHNGQRSQD